METEDPLRSAETLYNEPLNPNRTKEIERLLKQAAADGKSTAERKALEAIVALCDYLNRWNGVGKMDVRAAETEIQAALDVSPNLAAAYYARGFVFRTQGDHKQALEAFQKSLAIDPNNPRALAQEGAEHLYLGDPIQALAKVRKALEISPDHPARGMFRWIGARSLFFQEKYHDAIPWLEQSIALWPDLWYNRAYDVSAHALIDNKEKAREKLKDFIHRFPNLNTVKRIVEAEQTNPNNNPFVVEGRRRFHQGLRLAGMPPG